jgi:branched-chain amino acid aminotransferase
MDNPKAKYIFLNGQLVPYADARIHVLTPAAKYGATVYEGIRGYWSPEENQIYLFRLDDHLRRLFHSMEMTWMKPPYSLEEFKGHVIHLIKKNDFEEDIHIRIMVFVLSDDGSMISTEPVGAAIAALPMGRITSKSETGLRCAVSSWRRISDNSTPPRIKCAGNYQNSRLAGIQVSLDGYDNVIILNENGKVSEGAGSNIFLIRNGIPLTPSVTSNILEGITRDTIIRLFDEKHGLKTVEREIDRSELYVAEEIFYCGSASEIVPIISVDKHNISDGRPGPLTKAVKESYVNLVRGKIPDSRNWRVPVYDETKTGGAD